MYQKLVKKKERERERSCLPLFYAKAHSIARKYEDDSNHTTARFYLAARARVSE